MDETVTDMHEVKRLKKIELVQYNLGALLSSILLTYFVKNGGTVFVLFGLICTLLWINVAIKCYTLKSGKTIGTKTIRRVQDFEKKHLGKKRWNRKIMTEAVIISAINIVFTVLLFTMDFNSLTIDTLLFSLIGSWIGFNIGGILRL